MTGAGRSGTMWSAREIARVTGEPCTHERRFHLGISGPATGSEVSWMAAPHLTEVRGDYDAVVRLMRDPVASICSQIARGMWTPPNTYAQWALEQLGMRPTGRPIVDASQCWLMWQNIIEADITVDLTDVAVEGWAPTLRTLGFDCDNSPPGAPLHATVRRSLLTRARSMFPPDLVAELDIQAFLIRRGP